MSIHRLSDPDRSARLDAVVNQYIRKGYQAMDVRRSTATLKRGKRWNWVVFLLGGTLTGGLLALIYPFYYLFMAKGEILELNVDAVGNVKGTRYKAK